MEQQFQAAFAEPRTDQHGPRAGAAAAHGTTAVDRGADLLVRVLESEQPVALTDLARASGIPKSTASRLIAALERRGLVEQDGERGRLRPGPAILRVAQRGMLERNIAELAAPTLKRLSRLSGETINLAVAGHGGVEHIAQLDGKHFLGAGQWLGRSVDHHCSANGKVFLAYGRVETALDHQLNRYTDRTITDPARLAAELATVRAAGFATAIDELELGLAAIAAPVFGAGGDVVAALSISGPTLRMTPRRIAELKRPLIEEGLALSALLGHTHPGEDAA